ncbi:MAG: 50S ribosomal protein L3 [Dehalococcoidia bacterium]|nr:50S ribosomal protein L3 [Dehalococcoidia bacterium]
MLTAIIGKKIGMTRIVLENGEMVGVTAIEAGPCFVTQVKDMDKDGYQAVQLGFGQAKRLNASQKGHLKDINEVRHLHEFRDVDVMSVKRGDKVDVGFLNPGDFVNVSGLSKGRGFAGVVKRYHFAGGPKTHGQSDRHRAPGSIGATTSPGRVLKGKRMAGRMGGKKTTVRNVRVVKVDADRGLLLVEGSAPGARNGLLIIKKVRK